MSESCRVAFRQLHRRFQSEVLTSIHFYVSLSELPQGALDLRYLAAREARGKQHVKELMQRSQVHCQVASGLTDFASELLRYQMDTGPRADSFLEAFEV